MNKRWRARIIATLVTLVFVVGVAILMTQVFDLDAEGKLPYLIAFLTIGLWMGIFNWLKPKDDPNDDRNTSDPTAPKL